MKANIGTSDRIIRIVLGLALLSLLFILEGNMKYIGIIGVVPILTAFVKFCPIYALFGINSCKLKTR